MLHSDTARRPGSRRTTYSVLAACAVTGTLSGAIIAASGTTRSAAPNVDRPSIPPGAYVSSTISGPGLSVQAATSKVLDGLASSKMVSDVSVIPAPASDPLPNAAPWVVTKLSAYPGADDEGGQVRARWLAELADGSVSDLMRTSEPAGREVIGGGQVVEPTQDGSGSTTIPLGAGNTAGGQVIVSPSDAVLQERAASVATQFGLTLKSVQILHPLGSAIDIVFVVPDDLKPKWFAAQLGTALEGSPTQVDGTLITLESPDGTPLVVSGGSYRFGGGGVWFAPGQDARFGIAHGGVPGSAGHGGSVESKGP